MTDTTQTLRDQLLQLRQLHETGALDAAQYETSKAGLERKLLDAVLAAPASAAKPRTSAAPVAAVASAAPRTSGAMWAGTAAVVVAVAGLGYAWTGQPGEIGLAPTGFTAAQGGTGADGAGSAPHPMGGDQMEGMVAKLAARMQEQPDNAQGWGILGRSYMALGRAAEAMGAYERALKLLPNDVSLLVDYADALAVKNGRTLDGEPTKLIERALKLEPDNIKALTLAGTAAFNRSDYATAVKHWDRAVAVGPADSNLVDMARGGAAEARARGKLPAAAETAAPFNPVAAALAGPAVTGTVRLAAAFKAQAAPEDAVFVFARPAEGSRMPLAIVRMQVKDLPAQFKLDDSTSLSPATKLSGVKRVTVGARVSKSGQAMPQPGDLEGYSAPVDVGATGVAVEISNKLP